MSLLGNLSRLPGSYERHRWADWAELLCLNSAEGELSVHDLATAISQREEWRAAEAFDDPSPEEERIDPFARSRDDDPEDKSLSEAREILAYMTTRQVGFGAAYPFAVSEDGTGVCVIEETGWRNLYLLLLFSSSLRYVPNKSAQSKLTSIFELVCYVALKRHLGSSAEAHIFGKNALKVVSRYTGRLPDKLRQLAADLNERTVFLDSEFSSRDVGDNGLDIVAWNGFEDDVSGLIVYFGQCACTPRWVDKQHSVIDESWFGIMTLLSKPVPICFIPFDFRQADGSWYKKSAIHRTVLVDRRRLLSMLGTTQYGSTVEDAFPGEHHDLLGLSSISEERNAGLEDL